MDYRGYAKPTRMEQASWYAFGLYAYHQQGNQYKPMYKEGERFTKHYGYWRIPAKTLTNFTGNC